MKLNSIFVALALMCIGCGEDAQVLSSDGSKVLARCQGSSSWPDCVQKACPNGYEVVYQRKTTDELTIIKCKP